MAKKEEHQELLEKLEALRLKGVKVASIEEISDKQAERRAKKLQREAKELEQRRRKAEDLNDYRVFFPEVFKSSGTPKEKDPEKFAQQLAGLNFERVLWKTRNDVREFREAAIIQGIEHQELPDGLRKRVSLALVKFNHDQYRDVLGSLVIEGLKVQDRVIKRLAYDTADRWFSEGHYDFGWIMSMLRYPYPDDEEKDATFYYVSRYGWQLLRKYAKLIAPIGNLVLTESFNYWAGKPETWEKWNRLASEDGLPADIRELYAQIAGK